MTETIGVGIVTYKRPEYIKTLLETFPFDYVDEVIVVDDDPNSEFTPLDVESRDYHYHRNPYNLGVGRSKNICARHLLNRNCKHIFLVEDDVQLLDPGVFQKYIDTAYASGIYHLSFGHVGGPLNEQIKLKRQYPDGNGIQCYHNPQGSFCYFLNTLFTKIGMFDEAYVNAFEHIDYEYTLIRKGLLPPFWYFPDVADSDRYLKIVDGGEANSSITNKGNYTTNWQAGAQHFIDKWQTFTNKIPDEGTEKANEQLDFLYNTYSRENRNRS